MEHEKTVYYLSNKVAQFRTLKKNILLQPCAEFTLEVISANNE